MRTLRPLTSLIVLSVLMGCDGTNEATVNVSVEMYVEQLISNQYDSHTLPSFTPEDIPALLQYRNDNQAISQFPRNPISSHYGPECKLGMYVLWTVESIRLASNGSANLVMGFPSQNPILALRNPDELELVYDDQSHAIAAEAYLKWWDNNKDKKFDEFDDIDPLEGTDYRWH